MAGSYKHIVEEDGNLSSIEVVADMLETGGDMFEAIEEMYGMIWYLADKAAFGNHETMKVMVEIARNNYSDGLDISKEVHQ